MMLLVSLAARTERMLRVETMVESKHLHTYGVAPLLEVVEEGLTNQRSRPLVVGHCRNGRMAMPLNQSCCFASVPGEFCEVRMS